MKKNKKNSRRFSEFENDIIPASGLKSTSEADLVLSYPEYEAHSLKVQFEIKKSGLFAAQSSVHV